MDLQKGIRVEIKQWKEENMEMRTPRSQISNTK